MRGFGFGKLLAACGLAASLGLACVGSPSAIPNLGGTPANRAGAIRLTHASIAGGLPAETVLAVASFFAAPGPAGADAWPAEGACVVSSPTPTPSGSPSPTPAAEYHDAGSTLSLSSAAATLTLNRFATADGAILYVSDAGSDPASAGPGVVFDLDVPGGSGANALAPATLTSALVMPASLALSAPDFAGGPLLLARAAFDVAWNAGNPQDDVEITLALAGSNGAATLRCATPDDGSFLVGESLVASLPSGTGTLTVARRLSTQTALSASTVLVGDGFWVSGGVITLP